MKKVLYFFVFASTLFFALVSGCTDNKNLPVSPPLVDNENNGFETFDVAKIFAENCATSGCHAGTDPVNGLSIESHSALMKGSSNRPLAGADNFGGEVVIPYNSEKSLLYQMITDNITPSGIHSDVSLTDEEISTIKDWIDAGAKDNNGVVPFSNPTYRVFVCNQGGDYVSVIDGDEMVVSRLINVDFLSEVDAPHMVKLKDGYLYLTLIGDGEFLKIDTDDLSVTGKLTGIEKAGMIQISPDGSKAYVSRSSTSASIYNTIFVVDIQNMTVIKEINLPVTGVPHGIALTPDGQKLYVANLTKNRISLVDAVNDEFVDDIVLSDTIDHEPMQLAVSPDGMYLYCSARATGKLIVLRTSDNTIIAEIDVAPMPMQLAITSDGSRIYVPSMMTSTVSVIEKNGETWTKTAEVSHPALNMLHGIDLTADEKYLYVSSRNNDGMFQPPYKVNGEGNIGTVGILDTQTNQFVKVIEIEEFGAGLVVEK